MSNKMLMCHNLIQFYVLSFSFTLYNVRNIAATTIALRIITTTSPITQPSITLIVDFGGDHRVKPYRAVLRLLE